MGKLTKTSLLYSHQGTGTGYLIAIGVVSVAPDPNPNNRTRDITWTLHPPSLAPHVSTSPSPERRSNGIRLCSCIGSHQLTAHYGRAQQPTCKASRVTARLAERLPLLSETRSDIGKTSIDHLDTGKHSRWSTGTKPI